MALRFPGVAHDVATALLDVDGTLIDSNDAHARSWVDAFAESGYTVPFARVRPLIGMGADRLLPIAVSGLSEEAEPGRTIAARRGEIFRERYLSQVRPTRGARELVQLLVDGGVRCVAATSAKEHEVQALLERCGAADLIRIRSSADDAATSKPAPDIVHAALSRAGARPEESVLIGDTRFDVESARRAGVATIALRCGGASDRDLAAADAVYDDPGSLAAAMRLS